MAFKMLRDPWSLSSGLLMDSNTELQDVDFILNPVHANPLLSIFTVD